MSRGENDTLSLSDNEDDNPTGRGTGISSSPSPPVTAPPSGGQNSDTSPQRTLSPTLSNPIDSSAHLNTVTTSSLPHIDKPSSSVDTTNTEDTSDLVFGSDAPPDCTDDTEW